MNRECAVVGAAARALAERLRALESVLSGLDDATYLWQPASGVSGPIGAHVRHCLDHVDAVLAWQSGTVLSYDHRRRATVIEQDRRAARHRLLDVAEQLERCAGPTAALVLSIEITRHEAAVETPTSLAREFAFVLQHTIHHQAVIGVLLALRHVPVPVDFGLAPSTPLPAT